MVDNNSSCFHFWLWRSKNRPKAYMTRRTLFDRSKKIHIKATSFQIPSPPQRLLSGDIVKEAFLDILLTRLEQTAFSLSGTDVKVMIGDYVNCGHKIGERLDMPVVLGSSGKVIKMTQSQITIQNTQPILFYSEADIHVQNRQWVERGAPVLTLTHQTLITGDIVQGIPRIEQLFEAPASKEGQPLAESLHSQVREIFRKNWLQKPLPAAVRQSLGEIQQILVESLQKVYLAQGVLIADKHVEIVVRQMTSKGQILDCGNTGLLIEEVLPIGQIENANIATPGKKALYAPAVVGLTRAALESDSFISAASFQETTRVLSRDALVGKSDFMRGLKEKVVIGDLISAGTGLDIYFVYTLLSDRKFQTTLKIPASNVLEPFKQLQFGVSIKNVNKIPGAGKNKKIQNYSLKSRRANANTPHFNLRSYQKKRNRY